MRLFRKKNTKSTLRFCQSATELDTSHLFSDWPLRLAISRLTESHHPALEATKEAYGYGLVHEPWGGRGGPLLPVQVQFLFSPPDTEGDPGHGYVWKIDASKEEAHYKAEVFIHDPDRRIYEGFRRVFEHAAISGNSFAHLILLREKKPYISDRKEREAAGKAEREKLKTLMKQIDAGEADEADEADMPGIVFDRVAFEDDLVLKAPSWSWGWIDDPLSWPKYHSRELATWRRALARTTRPGN